jgi:hypothetical protein
MTKKGSLAPVAFTASFDAADNTVSLMISSNSSVFVNGGQIRITATGPTGVSSQEGVLLNPKYSRYAIARNASAVSLG